MFESSMEKYLPQFVDVGVEVAKASLRILLIIIAAYIGVRLLRLALQRAEAILVRAGVASETVPGAAMMRVRTLMSVLWTIAVGLIWFVAALTVLGQMGVNIAPILASAGVVGLAVGFGAQNLVKDLVSGFFLILENQIRVGDIAVINGTGGLVEAITFRTIVLRDLSGVVHVFPNGSVNTLANMTKDWSAYVLDIGVAYKEDTDHVIDVMRKVAEEMSGEPTYAAAMIEPIEIFGVDSFADSAVIIKARLKTRPLRQYMVGREYRRRLKKSFDAEGIEMPFPHRTLTMGQASPPFQFVTKSTQAIAESGN
jgi:moderate conductance mechanosensitive channel